MNIFRVCCMCDGDFELWREKLFSFFILVGLKLKEKENMCIYIIFYFLYVFLYMFYKLLKFYILLCLNNVYWLVVDCVNLVKIVECGFSFLVLDWIIFF